MLKYTIPYIKIMYCTLCAFLLFTQYSYAQEDITQLEIGMPRSEILGAVLPCENDLCGEILFGNVAWNGRYILEDDILAGIGISLPTTAKSIQAIADGLDISPYVLLYAETNNSYYNFLANARMGKKNEVMQEEFQAWVNSIRADALYTLYFYATPADFEYIKSYMEKKDKVRYSNNTQENSNLPSQQALSFEEESSLFSKDPHISKMVLTLVTITPKETRLLSATSDMLYDRLKEIQESSIQAEATEPQPEVPEKTKEELEKEKEQRKKHEAYI